MMRRRGRNSFSLGLGDSYNDVLVSKPNIAPREVQHSVSQVSIQAWGFPVSPDVQVHESGEAITLDNGVVAVRVSKSTGRVDWVRNHRDDTEACIYLYAWKVRHWSVGLSAPNI